MKKNVVGEETTSKERNDKTHSKVIRERRNEIYSKVIKGNFVKTHPQMVEKKVWNFLTKKKVYQVKTATKKFD